MNYRKYEILKLSRYIYIYKKKVKSKREKKKKRIPQAIKSKRQTKKKRGRIVDDTRIIVA